MAQLEYKIQPWPHQERAIEICKERDYFALFFKPGCGKTLTAINAMRWKFLQQKRWLRTLIICPKVMVETWRREIKANSGNQTFVRTQTLRAHSKARIKALKEGISSKSKFVFVTNTDAINTSLYEELLKTQWDILILDESHKFKRHEAKRTKKMIALADKIKYKYILTGTPITNSEMNIWAQFRILSLKILPPNFFSFRNEYFYDKNAGMPSHKYFPDWRPRPGAIDRLKKIIADNSITVETADVLNLPPFIKKKVYVDLTPIQKKHYDEMERDFITYINGEACSAEIVLTRLLRLQQITAGIVKTESGVVKYIDTGKLEALEELLEDICCEEQIKSELIETNPLPNKVIVWTNFVDTYQQIALICRKLELDYAMLVGGQTDKHRQAEIHRFNTDPKCRVFIANQSAGGVGIGLQAANYAIYYSKTFDVEHDEQSQARNNRGGSEIHSQIIRIDLLCKGTVDEDIDEALVFKRQLSDLMLDIDRKHNKQKNNNDDNGEEDLWL